MGWSHLHLLSDKLQQYEEKTSLFMHVFVLLPGLQSGDEASGKTEEDDIHTYIVATYIHIHETITRI